MRTLVLCTVLLATAFSGCLADPQAQSTTTTDGASPSDSADASGSESPSASGTASGTPTTTSAAGPNTAPTANLTTDVVNGTVPLNVTFTIDGSDEDGDELSWTLDVDGDGTEDYNGTGVPTAITHEFTEVGNYTAKLNVTDGEAFAESEALVSVEEAIVAVAGPLLCNRTATQSGAGEVYVFDGDGGTWAFVEANDIPGLQVENNHLSGDQAEALGFFNANWVGCEGGDQMMF